MLKFFLEIDCEHKGTIRTVSAMLVVPLQRSKTSNQLSELSFDDGKGIVLLITKLMELLDTELMLRGSVEELHIFGII